ncbi:Uncharacterised protein [Mycobacteroides abscessus subsp. abscessus]|nr:Uncharacterised protein [Mycobacteroides abscessus subsp. abscessus]
MASRTAADSTAGSRGISPREIAVAACRRWTRLSPASAVANERRTGC